MLLAVNTSELQPEILKEAKSVGRTTTKYSRLLFFCQWIVDSNDGL
jgi:hypothetical protein